MCIVEYKLPFIVMFQKGQSNHNYVSISVKCTAYTMYVVEVPCLLF